MELSMVILIMSLLIVGILQLATQALGTQAYEQTQAQLTMLDNAVDGFYKVNGRLPCPALRSLAPLQDTYGKEDCTLPVLAGTASTGGGGVQAGTVPFRTLNIPPAMAIDPWGDEINYFVTKYLASNSTDAADAVRGVGGIAIYYGPFTSAHVILPNTAYVLISYGADQRGGVSKMGIGRAGNVCAYANDVRIDAQNCVAITGSGSTNPNWPNNIFFDGRYNTGTVTDNYFDDIVVPRLRSQL